MFASLYTRKSSKEISGRLNKNTRKKIQFKGKKQKFMKLQSKPCRSDP